MISIDELNKIKEENNINIEAFHNALTNQYKDEEKYIDKALIEAAKNNENKIEFAASINSMQHLYAIVNIIKNYEKASYKVKIENFDYYSNNENSVLDNIAGENVHEQMKYLLIDLYHIMFDLSDKKLQYLLYRKRNLFFDKMTVAFRGAYISSVTISITF